MNILYALRAVQHFHYHKSTVRELASRGHSIEALFDAAKNEGITDRALRAAEAELPGFRSGTMTTREGWDRRFTDIARDVATYSWYLRMPDQSPYYRERWERVFPRATRWLIANRLSRSILSRQRISRALAGRSKAAKPFAPIVRELGTKRPDVIVASPMNMTQGREVDYVRAATSLGIRTVVPVLSWDNLTTKGSFHADPDVVLVWNVTQRNEAIRFHGIPEEKLVMTGSPVFDPWFQARAPRTREELARAAGLDPFRPIITYLGSSHNIAPDERPLIEGLWHALRGSNGALTDAQLVVRPHPGNASRYDALKLEGVSVWPRGGDLPDTPAGFDDFRTTLAHSIAAIGINTTGMIDAVIAGKPCVSILSDEHVRTQRQALHFQHLLQADVLELCKSVPEAVERLERLAAGEDSRAAARARFVQSFIRPHGLETPAADFAARAIELAAKGLSGKEIEAVFRRDGGE